MGKVRCLVCNTVLESKSRHDFQMCKCANQTHVDGGNDYMKAGGVDPTKVQVVTKCHGLKEKGKE